jgi:signal transduction histidine kinase
MTSADKAPAGLVTNSLHRLRHTLRTPLTAISINAQVLVQEIQCSPSLNEVERIRILESLTAMEEAIQALSREIDAISAHDNQPEHPIER